VQFINRDVNFYDPEKEKAKYEYLTVGKSAKLPPEIEEWYNEWRYQNGEKMFRWMEQGKLNLFKNPDLVEDEGEFRTIDEIIEERNYFRERLEEFLDANTDERNRMRNGMKELRVKRYLKDHPKIESLSVKV